MNAHATADRTLPPRFPPSPGSLAAAAASRRAGTPVSRTAAFAELIAFAGDEFDKLSIETGTGRCYVPDVYAAEAAMLDAVLCQKPENSEDVLLLAIAGMVRSEALVGLIADPKTEVAANALSFAFLNIAQFLAMDDGARSERLERFPGIFGIVFEQLGTASGSSPATGTQAGQ